MDFGEVERLQHEGRWQELEQLMLQAAQSLERGGADFLVICTNTMHRMYEALERQVQIPIMHIADPRGQQIQRAGLTRVGLLGTAFTMEQDFYKGRLARQFGFQVLTPDDADRRTVHDIIYRELVAGVVQPASREQYRAVMARLVEQGAQAIILGCTEIMLLINQSDSPVPIFDTTELHARAAVDRALQP